MDEKCNNNVRWEPLTTTERVEYNADLRLVLENWGVAIPSAKAEAAFDRVVKYNRRSGCYVI